MLFRSKLVRRHRRARVRIEQGQEDFPGRPGSDITRLRCLLRGPEPVYGRLTALRAFRQRALAPSKGCDLVGSEWQREMSGRRDPAPGGVTEARSLSDLTSQPLEPLE